MKIKLWQWEYDFDKEDAKIVVPLILLLLALFRTEISTVALLAVAAAYYLLYFFLKPSLLSLGKGWSGLRSWLSYRCPYCKSRQLIMQGYQPYHSDEFYAYHLCNRCRKTSILVNDRLIKALSEPDGRV